MAYDPKELFSEMSPETFALWTHSPITAAYLAFIEDQIANWREAAADLVEMGVLKVGADIPDHNLDSMRGRLATLRELRGISLADIQRFYGVSSQDTEDQETGNT